ncbi:hypothetical protein GCM10023149_18670 [Mucilaginibacter gynuensis]|uniref:Fibronectin type-III domain-containing protein n=1 Tax=Mucilaginibacter gynuensis TaxID=1302236 RepID=A0ABP8G8X8_9SPHI
MRKVYSILTIALLCWGCASKKSNDTEPKPDPVMPDKVVMSLPANNELCNTGEVVSTTKSKVNFKWNTAKNADKYELVITNLQTNDVLKTNQTKTDTSITINRNAPYKWQVIAYNTASGKSVASDNWKFYNSGPATVSYAPFPAEIIAPINQKQYDATVKKVTLEWKGSDVDNDITNYEIYFGTSTTPVSFKKDLSSTTLDVDVTGKTTYYWQVITKDSKGNTSASGINSFKVN